MLTFRQGHEKGERQSDQVAGSESFCSPRILCVYGGVCCYTARERMAHPWLVCLPAGFVLVGVTAALCPPPPGSLPGSGSAGKAVNVG